MEASDWLRISGNLTNHNSWQSPCGPNNCLRCPKGMIIMRVGIVIGVSAGGCIEYMYTTYA